jgi:predicted enzyme related to lactoylglutathione lyase
MNHVGKVSDVMGRVVVHTKVKETTVRPVRDSLRQAAVNFIEARPQPGNRGPSFARSHRVLQLDGSLVVTKSFEIGELGDSTTIMRDPEGNGFCLEDPPNTERAHIWNVTFACAEPRELGRFWALALGWPDEDIDESIFQNFRDAGVGEPDISGFHVVKAPNGSRPRFYFHRREKSRPESYPMHLDFATDDREAEVERLVQAGASVVETKQGTNVTFTIMRDPEGNPFCVG